jgi:hypothetical protein
MTSVARRLSVGCGGVLVAVPGVAAAQPLGPSVVADAPPSARAVASFVLVLLAGGLLLTRYGGFVDRSVDSSKERLLVSVVYGGIAYGLVAFACVYAYSQLARLGVGGAVLSTVAVGAVGAILVAMAGLGFVVVGTLLTELGGQRQPWTGLVVGAAVSAVAWLALPLVAAVVAWFVVTAVGIGGSTRKWVHAERAPRIETDG